MATRSLAIIGHSNKMGQDPMFTILLKKWSGNYFPSFIEKGRWPSNSPDLNPLDYCIRNELVKRMNWSQVLTKQDLIDELHHSTKKFV